MGLARQNVYYFFGRLVGAAISLISLAVFTRLLTPSNYGRYSVFVAIGGLVAGVVFQWFRQCLIQFGGDAKSREPLLASIGLLFWTAIAAIVVSALAASFVVSVNPGAIEITGLEIIVLCAFAVAQSWFELSADAVRLDFQAVKYGMFNVLRAALSLGLGAAAAMATRSPIATIVGTALGYAVAGYVAAPRWLRGLFSIRLASRDRIKVLAGYGLPLSLTLGMAFILDSIDRLMLAAMRDATTAGVYSSAYNLSQFSIGTILSGLGLAVLPLAAAAFHRNEVALSKRLIERNVLVLMGIGLPAVVGLCFEAPALARLMLGNYQPEVSDSVMILVSIASGFAGLRAYGYDLIFMVYNNTKQQAAILVLSAAINVVLNVILIPRAGAEGAAWATLLAFMFALIASVVAGRRTLKLDYPIGSILKVCSSAFVMALVLYGMPAKVSWTNLVVAIVVGAITYGAALLAMNPGAIRPLIRRVSGFVDLGPRKD